MALLRRSLQMACVLAPALLAQRDLTEISLEELMKIEVVSVSKKQQLLTEVPAAVYVITQEDLRRSGATSIPEALRMAPGVQVARIDASKWAISVRGFNGRWANKLLVLIDGRSVYSPVNSGVYWHLQDTLLEDVERIEVIRGPGATVWGANAVNGVINVITRQARDTQGGLLVAGAGTEERGSGALRWGGQAGSAWCRVYAKYFQRSPMLTRSGARGDDGWDTSRGGFRLDWEPSPANAVTLDGAIFRGKAGQRWITPSLTPPYAFPVTEDVYLSGGHLLARWRHNFADGGQATWQFYYDGTRRSATAPSEAVDTWDFEFQHRLRPLARHDVQWGLQGRLVRHDQRRDSFVWQFSPGARGLRLGSVFLQDEVTLVEGRLWATLGLKAEHHTYTGWEAQPGAQLLWRPHPNHALWVSAARAVRMPSRMERDARLNATVFPGPGGMLTIMSILGSSQLHSEALRAYEAGHRWQAGRRFSVDLAAFHSAYHGLVDAEPARPYWEPTPAPAHLLIPLVFANFLHGHTYGAEATGSVRLHPRWQVHGGYSWLRINLHPAVGAESAEQVHAERESPRHQAHLRSYLDLPGRWSWDAALYYTGALGAVPGAVGHAAVSGYTRVDTRLGWRPSAPLEVSVGLTNLSDPAHPEFESGAAVVVTGSQVRRSVYGRITWRF